jgi:predicted PurR-regulated permease PerM
MDSELTARRFFVFLLIISTLCVVLLIAPIAKPLLMAAVLANVLWRVHRKLAAGLHHRPSLAAGLLVFGVVILMVGPLAGLSAFVVNEAEAGVKFVTGIADSTRASEWIERLPEPFRESAQDALERVPRATATAVAAAWAALTATGYLVFNTVLMLIALFFLLIQGDALVHWLDHTLPLRRGQTRELLAEFRNVSYTIVASTVITAAIQSAVALVGYFIAHVPHPVFFCALTFFFAVIPGIGASGVCVVAALILLAMGHPYMATFLAIWGVFVVGLVDNVVKPLLVRGGMQMPGAVVFFALLGGLAAFGGIGLVLGPLLVSLLVTLLRMFKRDFAAPSVESGAQPV